MRSIGRSLAGGLAAGAILALVSGCSGTGSAADGDGHGSSGSNVAAGRSPARSARTAARKPDLALIEREVVQRVNRYRKSEGLPALASDARIAEIARGHSRAMANGRTGFGHGGFRDRSDAVASRVPFTRVAENVARQQRDPREIPAVAVDRWIGSRGHRRNIEGPYAVTGVGAAVAPDGSVYLTQLFVDPR